MHELQRLLFSFHIPKEIKEEKSYILILLVEGFVL